MKSCQICGYEPSKEDEVKPDETNEDCPQCGGVDTMIDENAEAALDRTEKEDEG
jgi:Zn finger protein HypA/HybF involved in hydrogenase expression